MPSRTINFCRAQYDTTIIDRNFEEVLRGGHGHLNTPNERTFFYRDPEFVRCLDYKEHENHILFHVCAYEPGGSTLTIPGHTVELEENVEATENNPPAGKDYMNKDIFVLVSGNDVVYCTSGLPFSGFRVYSREIVLNFEGAREANTYSFPKITNVDKVRYVREHGVKEIRLSSALDQQETKEVQGETTKGQLVTFVKEIFGGRNLNLDDVENSDKILASLSLRFDTRPKKNQMLFDPMSQLAEGILEDDDISFKLFLANGNHVTSNEITQKKTLDILKRGNSVDKNYVWNKLQETYAEFKG